MNPSLDTAAGSRPPTLLLVEDDPVSQCFLQEALAALPAQVHAAGTAAEALRLVVEAPPSLCLIDAHLPDASGLGLLQALRTHGVRAPALAHTAESAPTLHDALRAGGFVAVLRKPLSVAELHAAVRDALGGGDGAAAAGASDAVRTTASTETPADTAKATAPDAHASSAHASSAHAPDAYAGESGGEPGRESADAHGRDPQLAALPVWDDTAGLRALNGNAAIVEGMRTLFRGELAQTLPRIAALREAGDHAALHGELHKLKAATAFVGATRLAAAVAALAECHARGHADARAYAEVVTAAEALLRAG